MSETRPSINITAAAGEKIASILSQQPSPMPHFRVQIKGGGCTGFEYMFGIDQSIRNKDFQQTCNAAPGFTILIDPISIQYLNNVTIDYRLDTHGERFVIENPNAQISCSCGSSFAPKEQPESS